MGGQRGLDQLRNLRDLQRRGRPCQICQRRSCFICWESWRERSRYEPQSFLLQSRTCRLHRPPGRCSDGQTEIKALIWISSLGGRRSGGGDWLPFIMFLSCWVFVFHPVFPRAPHFTCLCVCVGLCWLSAHLFFIRLVSPALFHPGLSAPLMLLHLSFSTCNLFPLLSLSGVQLRVESLSVSQYVAVLKSFRQDKSTNPVISSVLVTFSSIND